MKKRSLVLLFLSGCIDLEGAHKECFASGLCGDVVDAGDSGVIVIPDSGTSDPTYDGGTPCTSSPHPKLKCDAPLTVFAGGSGINNAALVALPDGFLAGWTSNGFDLRKVDMAGNITSVHSDPSGIVNGQLSLAETTVGQQAGTLSEVSDWLSNQPASRRTLSLSLMNARNNPGAQWQFGDCAMVNWQPTFESSGPTSEVATLDCQLTSVTMVGRPALASWLVVASGSPLREVQISYINRLDRDRVFRTATYVDAFPVRYTFPQFDKSLQELAVDAVELQSNSFTVQ